MQARRSRVGYRRLGIQVERTERISLSIVDSRDFTESVRGGTIHCTSNGFIHFIFYE